MPSPDDERFEQYLKEFRPIAPPSLPIQRGGGTSRRAVAMASLVGIAAVLVVAAVLWRSGPEPNQSPQSENRPVAVDQLAAQLLTIRSANAMLAQAPSTKAAIDSVAWPSQKPPLPQGKRSAFAELSKEKTKL